jgi:hypothetical protein
VRCFTKSEPLQSERRLKEIQVKERGRPKTAEELEKINLNQAISFE